jgi:polyprenyl-phospho-N-acetylgalactosaminyl synthase
MNTDKVIDRDDDARCEPLPADVWVIIPAFNEGTMLTEVLNRVLTVCRNVVVIDDGSRDGTQDVADQLPVHVLKHCVNLGQGAALQTGIDYALSQGAGRVVTFDADGQMDESEIGRLCAALEQSGSDVALGSRFLGSSTAMPKLRRLVLRLAVLFTWLTTGLRLTDVHNGFRAFSRAAAARLELRQNRMAHASEILTKIAQLRLSYVEVPVAIRYTDYSLSKGQSVFNLVNILWDLLFH